MKNQLILNAPILPEGYEWEIHNYATPSGMVKAREVKFKHFSQATWKQKIGNFHAFELQNGGDLVWSYCLIVKSK